MHRYFFEIAYDGSNFSGWQQQDDTRTVQGFIESRLSMLYDREMNIVGCGRTDTGVHAAQYYFHADLPIDAFTSDELCFKLNNMLGPEIAVKRVLEVNSEAHARFDAISRSYSYYVSLSKNPFKRHYRYEVPQSDKLNVKILNEAAQTLLEYDSFFPFCKTNSDVSNYKCELYEAKWTKETDDLLIFNISSNRFLRGMVRLIVGMCINVNMKKMTVQELRMAMDKQERLNLAWSAPGHALFLDAVKYPYI